MSCIVRSVQQFSRTTVLFKKEFENLKGEVFIDITILHISGNDICFLTTTYQGIDRL